MLQASSAPRQIPRAARAASAEPRRSRLTMRCLHHSLMRLLRPCRTRTGGTWGSARRTGPCRTAGRTRRNGRSRPRPCRAKPPRPSCSATAWTPPGSRPNELKRRWQDLARRHHPDLGGDMGVMQEINAAYSFLKPRGGAAPTRDTVSPRIARRCRFGPGPGTAAGTVPDELILRHDYTDRNFLKKRLWELSGRSQGGVDALGLRRAGDAAARGRLRQRRDLPGDGARPCSATAAAASARRARSSPRPRTSATRRCCCTPTAGSRPSRGDGPGERGRPRARPGLPDRARGPARRAGRPPAGLTRRGGAGATGRRRAAPRSAACS